MIYPFGICFVEKADTENLMRYLNLFWNESSSQAEYCHSMALELEEVLHKQSDKDLL